tara:strand:+ start:6389 stop:6592 length:204 start_codon:yes stop_codon:yes gene_type:complete
MAGKYKRKTQKSDTSSIEEQKRVRYDMAASHGSVSHPIKGKGKKIKKGVRRNSSTKKTTYMKAYKKK